VDRADAIRAAVSAIPFVLPLRISAGVAGWPLDAENRAELLERADVALYAAKRAGKNRTELAVA
jgi:GGDEF domain-containing protein